MRLDSEAVDTTGLNQACPVGQQLRMYDAQHNPIVVEVDRPELALWFQIAIVHEHSKFFVALNTATQHQTVARLEDPEKGGLIRKAKGTNEQRHVQPAFASRLLQSQRLCSGGNGFRTQAVEQSYQGLVAGLVVQRGRNRQTSSTDGAVL